MKTAWKSDKKGRFSARAQQQMADLRKLIENDRPLRPCPFCGTEVGVLFISGGFKWFGYHKEPCVLEGNPSGWYGSLDHMMGDWNATPRDYEQKPKHRQAPVRRKVGATRRK